jgi:transcriptional regulator with XRE-family HTH domain
MDSAQGDLPRLPGRPSLKASMRPGVIRQLRERRDLSQEQLAEQVGVAVGTISRYERGSLAPTRRRLAKIAKALGTTPEILAQDQRSDAQPPITGLQTRANRLKRGGRPVSCRREIQSWWTSERTRLRSLRVDESVLQRLDELSGALIREFDRWFRERPVRESHDQRVEWNYAVFPVPLVLLSKLTRIAMDDRWL